MKKNVINRIEKKFFLHARLVLIKEDIRNEQGNGFLDYKKTLIRIFELCEVYGISPYVLSEWVGWHDFCKAYEVFLVNIRRINW